MARKRNRVIVHLRSESGYHYTTHRNKKTPKLQGIRKYDPNTRQHEEFNEKSK